MLIQTADKDTSVIVFNGESHKVVSGIASVPQEVRDHLVSYPEWSDVTEPVDEKILKKLGIKEKKAESGNDPNGEQNPEDDTNGDGNNPDAN